MSQAFVKDEDPQWLHEIPGTISALINYLTRENNGIRVYEKRKYLKDGIEVHEMSNGLPYSKDAKGKWQIAVKYPKFFYYYFDHKYDLKAQSKSRPFQYHRGTPPVSLHPLQFI